MISTTFPPKTIVSATHSPTRGSLSSSFLLQEVMAKKKHTQHCNNVSFHFLMYYFLIAAKLQNNYELRGMNEEKSKKEDS